MDILYRYLDYLKCLLQGTCKIEWDPDYYVDIIVT